MELNQWKWCVHEKEDCSKRMHKKAQSASVYRSEEPVNLHGQQSILISNQTDSTGTHMPTCNIRCASCEYESSPCLNKFFARQLLSEFTYSAYIQ